MQKWELCKVDNSSIFFYHPEEGYRYCDHKSYTMKTQVSIDDTLCKLLADGWEPFFVAGNGILYYFRRLVSQEY